VLHKNPEIIARKTFGLIQKLQEMPELREFHLVVGTALALQLGHRNSIDIDLFTRIEFHAEELFESLAHSLKIVVTLSRRSTLLCRVDDVKVDIVRHDYAYLKPPITEEGIRFLSIEDIAAMKPQVIWHNGKRLKDFIDLYSCSNIFQ